MFENEALNLASCSVTDHSTSGYDWFSHEIAKKCVNMPQFVWLNTVQGCLKEDRKHICNMNFFVYHWCLNWISNTKRSDEKIIGNLGWRHFLHNSYTFSNILLWAAGKSEPRLSHIDLSPPGSLASWNNFLLNWGMSLSNEFSKPCARQRLAES